MIIVKIILILIAISFWVACGLCATYLVNRGINNKYGWGLRALPIVEPLLRFDIHTMLTGPFGLLIPFIIYGKYVYISREDSLKYYDAKNIQEYGYEVGKRIAERDGRLKEK